MELDLPKAHGDKQALQKAWIRLVVVLIVLVVVAGITGPPRSAEQAPGSLPPTPSQVTHVRVIEPVLRGRPSQSPWASPHDAWNAPKPVRGRGALPVLDTPEAPAPDAAARTPGS